MAAQNIRIFNFSHSGLCKKTSEYFRLKCASFCYLVVEVHPGGIRNKEYVSVRILKLSRNARAWSYVNNYHLSWTLSVVDVNGDARCGQSFVIENAAEFTHEDILDFQKRSRLLSLADELLPEDVLTVRCELQEIFIGVDALLLPNAKEERPSKSLSHLRILNTGIDRKRGEARIALEIHKIYSSIMKLCTEVTPLSECRQEERRNVIANYDALDEIRQTYLSSKSEFSLYLKLKESMRRAINDGKEGFIGNLLKTIPLESNSDGETQKISQLAADPPKDKSKSFFETVRREDRKSERAIEVDQPFDLERKLNTEWKNFSGNFLNLMPLFLDNIFDQNTANTYDEKDCQRETLRQDISLSQKDEGSERATENVQPTDNDFFSASNILKESLKDGFGLLQHFMGEKNFGLIHENAYREQGCKKEEMAEINSKPSQGEFQFLPGTVGQECSSSSQDGVIESRNETNGPYNLEYNDIVTKCVESAQKLLGEVQLTADTQYEKMEREMKNTQIGAIFSKDEAIDLARYGQQVCQDFLALAKALNTCPALESSLNDQYGESQISMQRGQPSDLTMEVSSEVMKPMEKLLLSYIKPVEKMLFNYGGNEEHDSAAENQATWNLYLETTDGITFTIPFEDGRETLGSKLVSRSKVFQEMLDLNPKRQTPEEKVKLKDEDCDTFINFLSFLQTKDIEVETFPELISLYIFADKYDVQELMLLCAERMQPFFSPSNIDEVEEMACIYYDEHLLELVQLYKDKIIHQVSELNEDTEPLLNESSRDFDFYM